MLFITCFSVNVHNSMFIIQCHSFNVIHSISFNASWNESFKPFSIHSGEFFTIAQTRRWKFSGIVLNFSVSKLYYSIPGNVWNFSIPKLLYYSISGIVLNFSVSKLYYSISGIVLNFSVSKLYYSISGIVWNFSVSKLLYYSISAIVLNKLSVSKLYFSIHPREQ